MRGRAPYFVAAVLTWIAGYVDAVGFISLGHIYTANMSGNSVSLGIGGASQNWFEAARRIWPVIMYVTGLVFCRILIQFGARQRIRTIASITLSCEIALLLPVYLGHLRPPSVASELSFGYIALLAAAMGVQNATLTHFSALKIHTGFVTGTLVMFAEQFAKCLTWLFDYFRNGPAGIKSLPSASFAHRPFRLATWLAAIWIAYVVGAACGALGDYNFNLKALIVPITGVAILAAFDLRKPLAIAEEEEQDDFSAP